MVKAIKRVLVTGITGFMGKNLVDRLSKRYEIVGIVRDRDYKRGDIEVIFGDISDENDVRRAMKNIDVVVHMAAILNPFDKDIRKVNVESTKILLKAAKEHRVRKFVFIGSENSLFDFDDEYSKTKRESEELVRSFGNHLILRPTTVYGEYDTRYIRRLVDMAKSLKIAVVPQSKRLFQPVYVGDVMKCIDNGIRYDIKGEYVVAGPSKISYDDFTDMIIEELHKKNVVRLPIKFLKFIDFVNTKFIRSSKLRLFQVKSLEIDKVYDIRKSKRELRYTPTPLRTGIRKTLKFLKRL